MPGIAALGKRFIFKRFGGRHYSSDDFTLAMILLSILVTPSR